MKSRDDKIRDMAKELRRLSTTGAWSATAEWATDMAERLLDAAEREEPKWPTKESFHAALEVFSNFDEPVTPLALQSALAAAMHADPIIQAAIRWAPVATVSPNDPMPLIYAAKDLAQAIRDAGLFDGTEGK